MKSFFVWEVSTAINDLIYFTSSGSDFLGYQRIVDEFLTMIVAISLEIEILVRLLEHPIVQLICGTRKISVHLDCKRSSEQSEWSSGYLASTGGKHSVFQKNNGTALRDWQNWTSVARCSQSEWHLALHYSFLISEIKKSERNITSTFTDIETTICETKIKMFQDVEGTPLKNG